MLAYLVIAPLVAAGGLETILAVGAVADGRICDAGGAVGGVDRRVGSNQVAGLVILIDSLACADLTDHLRRVKSLHQETSRGVRFAPLHAGNNFVDGPLDESGTLRMRHLLDLREEHRDLGLDLLRGSRRKRNLNGTKDGRTGDFYDSHNVFCF